MKTLKSAVEQYKNHFMLLEIDGTFRFGQNMGYNENGEITFRYKGETISKKTRNFSIILDPETYNNEVSENRNLKDNFINQDHLVRLPDLEPIHLEIQGKVINTGAQTLPEAVAGFRNYAQKQLGMNAFQAFQLIVANYSQMQETAGMSSEVLTGVVDKFGGVVAEHTFPSVLPR